LRNISSTSQPWLLWWRACSAAAPSMLGSIINPRRRNVRRACVLDQRLCRPRLPPTAVAHQ
jgi:hypothetical protein